MKREWTESLLDGAIFLGASAAFTSVGVVLFFIAPSLQACYWLFLVGFLSGMGLILWVFRFVILAYWQNDTAPESKTEPTPPILSDMLLIAQFWACPDNPTLVYVVRCLTNPPQTHSQEFASRQEAFRHLLQWMQANEHKNRDWMILAKNKTGVTNQ